MKKYTTFDNYFDDGFRLERKFNISKEIIDLSKIILSSERVARYVGS